MSLTVNIYIYSTKGHGDKQTSPVADGHSVPHGSANVSKAKPVEPATTRKKNKELLQKHGFDVLGQSFGIPSRVDYESYESYESYEREVPVGTPHKQTAHLRSTSVSASDQDIEVYFDSDSSPAAKLKPPHGKRGSPTSSPEKRLHRKHGQAAVYPENYHPSTNATRQAHHQRSRSISQSTSSSSVRESPKQMVLYESDDDREYVGSENTQSSTSFYVPPPPPPPQIPRQEACYSTHPAMAGYQHVVYPIVSNGFNAVQGPVATPFPRFYHSQPLPHYAHVANPSMHQQAFAVNQPGSLPMLTQLPQQQLMSPAVCIPHTPNFAAGLAPPPPPPPPAPPAPQADHQTEVVSRGSVPAEVNVDKTASAGMDEAAHENNVSSGHQDVGSLMNRNLEPSDKQTSKMPTDKTAERAGKSTAAHIDEEPSRFPYKHLCAGCGQRRSNGYHMTHRLKNGETSKHDYCRRCVASAAFTDSEAPSIDGHSQLFAPQCPQSSSRSSGANSQIKKGLYVFDDRSRRHKLHNKPRRRSFLKSFLHYSKRNIPSAENRSLSSAEGASSRASSPAPGYKVRRKPSHVSTKGSSHRERNATPATDTAANRQQFKSGSHRSDSDTTNLPTAYNGYNDDNENHPASQTPPQTRSGFSTVSATNSGQAMSSHKRTNYKQPTVRNEASELTNKGAGSSALDDHTVIPTRSYEGLAPVSSQASAMRCGASGIKESSWAKQNTPRSPDETFFPQMRSPLQNEEVDVFGMYDSSPRDGFGSIPPTPTDPASSMHFAHPHIMDDSWGYDQSHCEKMAEELAEEELMRAGKRSGLFDSSRSSSTASSNPFFGNLTPSLISIESCPSDEERTDGNYHYEMATVDGSDGEDEDTAVGKKSPKQLEFSSSEEQSCKTANRSYNKDRHVRTTRNHKSTIARDMYNSHDTDSTMSSHSSDSRPPADGSSILAHTGHSMDDIPITGSQALRRRIRRLGAASGY